MTKDSAILNILQWCTYEHVDLSSTASAGEITDVFNILASEVVRYKAALTTLSRD